MITTPENFGGDDHCIGEHLMHSLHYSFLLTTESKFASEQIWLQVMSGTVQMTYQLHYQEEPFDSSIWKKYRRSN